MAINCDPGELVTLSKCFICLSPEQREAVKTYLLAVLAGGSLDPDVLMEEAKCWVCVPDQIALQNYLLCQAVNNFGGGGPPAACANQEGAGDPT